MRVGMQRRKKKTGARWWKNNAGRDGKPMSFNEKREACISRKYDADEIG